jgi:hypothetical protein
VTASAEERAGSRAADSHWAVLAWFVRGDFLRWAVLYTPAWCSVGQACQAAWAVDHFQGDFPDIDFQGGYSGSTLDGSPEEDEE